MTCISYIDGDATKPHGQDNRLIIHCCNNEGGWGAGFVLALNKKWASPLISYKRWSQQKQQLKQNNFKLGNIQIVPVADGIAVANMIGQHKCVTDSKGNPPIRYKAIRKCLKKIAKYCKANNVSVHAPKFGADLAGGDWNVIEQIIIDELCKKNIPVTVYNFKPTQ